jgi:hypothetical protein
MIESKTTEKCMYLNLLIQSNRVLKRQSQRESSDGKAPQELWLHLQ